jgi:hypothetical protein
MNHAPGFGRGLFLSRRFARNIDHSGFPCNDRHMRVGAHPVVQKAVAVFCLLLLIAAAPGLMAACTGSGHCVPMRASAEHACCQHRIAVSMSCCQQNSQASCRMQKQCCGSVQPGVRTESARGAGLAAIAVILPPQPFVFTGTAQLSRPAPSPPPKPVFELKTDLRI